MLAYTVLMQRQNSQKMRTVRVVLIEARLIKSFKYLDVILAAVLRTAFARGESVELLWQLAHHLLHAERRRSTLTLLAGPHPTPRKRVPCCGIYCCL